MSTFKKLFVTLVLVLFVTCVSFAQVNKNWDGVKPEVKKGAHSLVFMYSPFVSGSLGTVYAGSFSEYTSQTGMTQGAHGGAGYRYFLSDQFSLMGGIYFGIGSLNGTADTITQSYTDYGISLDGMYQFKPMYSIAPYIGLQASYGSHEFEQTNQVQGFSGQVQEKDVFSGSAFGVGLGVGFDWYFTEGMSLGGKYTIGLRSYTAPEHERTRANPIATGTVTQTRVGPDAMSTGFGVASIYLNVHLPY